MLPDKLRVHVQDRDGQEFTVWMDHRVHDGNHVVCVTTDKANWRRLQDNSRDIVNALVEHQGMDRHRINYVERNPDTGAYHRVGHLETGPGQGRNPENGYEPRHAVSQNEMERALGGPTQCPERQPEIDLSQEYIHGR